MGMQVARSNLNKDTQNFVRDTLCTRTTVRIFVQAVFATITVASFILILIMSLKSPVPISVVKPEPSRCMVISCRVICRQAPMYDKYEDDITSAIAEGETKCSRLSLELHSPMFVNKTLPETWLSGIRAYISRVSIILGNLEHFPCGCFMSHYARTIQTIDLHGLNLKSWHPHSLVGLSSLRTINIIRTRMIYAEANFLRPVDNTLETLVVSHSGHWDPQNVTGSKGFTSLVVVDFSFNEFGDILGAESFVGLDKCKILYLNSCKITSIAAGAFDHLLSIEVLYLNYNRLKTVPPGLFNTITAIAKPIPRINLQDNQWKCDCGADDLRQLITKDLLLIDAICMQPSDMEYKTFSEFEYYCVNGQFPVKENVTQDNTTNGIIAPSASTFGVNYNIYCLDGSYCKKNTSKASTFRVIGVDTGNRCTLAKLNTSLVNFHLHNNFEEEKSKVKLLFDFTFVYESETYTVLQIDSFKPQGYGLVWYDWKCPNEAYCVDEVPKFLRIYNMKKETTYRFCALDLDSGEIEEKNCVNYVLSDTVGKNESFERQSTGISTFAYAVTIVLCLCFGASLVYALIRTNPILLKGSKRIVFVKHKTVDALVLPPTLPLRNNEMFNESEKKVNNIFTVSKFNNLAPKELNFDRQKSVRSNKSGTPSYVSALEPTDDQLAEWRIKHHFNNDLSLSSTKSEFSSLSYNVPEAPYCSLDESDSTYESIK